MRASASVLAPIFFGMVVAGCGTPLREAHVTLIGSGDSPALEDLEVVEVHEAEWKQILLHRSARPCDRRAHYVGRDNVALLREALRSAQRKGLDVDCDTDSASLVVDGKKIDVDFVRAEVGSDASGKGARFQGLSTKSGTLVDGLIHATPEDRDGIVVTSLRSYLPTQLGAIFFWQKDDRYELFITPYGASPRGGIYVVAPIWDGGQFRVGVARFRVTAED
jgi:hypothetical protein